MTNVSVIRGQEVADERIYRRRRKIRGAPRGHIFARRGESRTVAGTHGQKDLLFCYEQNGRKEQDGADRVVDNRRVRRFRSDLYGG